MDKIRTSKVQNHKLSRPGSSPEKREKMLPKNNFLKIVTGIIRWIGILQYATYR